MSEKDYKKELLKELFANSIFSSLHQRLSEDDKKQVDKEVETFIDIFAAPLIQQFEKLSEDPETLAALRSELAKRNGKVIKEDPPEKK